MTPRTILLAALTVAACAAPGADADLGPQPAANPVQPQSALTVFEMTVGPAPTDAIAGREVVVKLSVEPRAPWHLNLDYPVQLRLDDSANVEVPISKQGPEHAERFDVDALVFAVPLVPVTPGDHVVAGRLRFATCAQDACSPQSVPVEIPLAAGCEPAVLNC